MKLGPSQVKWFEYHSISTHFIRPSGETRTIDLPTSANKFYVVRYPPSQPDKAHIVSTVLSKEELYHHFFHFYVTKPNPMKRCSSCHQPLADTPLCIQTEASCILFFFKYYDNSDREINPCEDWVLSKRQVLASMDFTVETSTYKSVFRTYGIQLKTAKPFNNLIWIPEEHQEAAKMALSSTNWKLEVIPSLNRL
jgi:hypothetical protein